MKNPTSRLRRHFLPSLIAAGGIGLPFASAQDFLRFDTFSAANLSQPESHAPANLGSFNIVINAGPSLIGNTAAMNAFTRAAQQWEAFIADPITVTIDADLAALGPGIIGSAGSVILQGSFNEIRDEMVFDASNESDDLIASFLPTAAQFTALLKPGSTLTGDMLGTKANLKAVGFTGLDIAFGVSDATINFSSNFAFDYDNSDGVGVGLIDFETAAAHELGHALGFISAVDDADGGVTNMSPFMLDLFRFRNGGAGDPANNSQFTLNSRDLVPGQAGIFDDLDNEWLLSTGLTQGDGRQASHWKDDGLTGNHIGVMDPTLASGLFFDVAAPDLRALDLIGYEIITVPEPSSLLLVAVSGMFVVGSRRRMPPVSRKVAANQA